MGAHPKFSCTWVAGVEKGSQKWDFLGFFFPMEKLLGIFSYSQIRPFPGKRGPKIGIFLDGLFLECSAFPKSCHSQKKAGPQKWGFSWEKRDLGSFPFSQFPNTHSQFLGSFSPFPNPSGKTQNPWEKNPNPLFSHILVSTETLRELLGFKWILGILKNLGEALQEFPGILIPTNWS